MVLDSFCKIPTDSGHIILTNTDDDDDNDNDDQHHTLFILRHSALWDKDDKFPWVNSQLSSLQNAP